MGRNKYIELLQEFCEAKGIEASGDLIEYGLLEVDGTLMSIEYLEERDEVRLVLPLGHAASGDGMWVLFKLLLEANLGHTTLCWPVFSLDSQSGQPLAAYHLPLQALLDEVISLEFVIEEQMFPLLREWECTVRAALDDHRTGGRGAVLPRFQA